MEDTVCFYMLKYVLIAIDVTKIHFEDTKSKIAGDCFNNLPVIIHCAEALTFWQTYYCATFSKC